MRTAKELLVVLGVLAGGVALAADQEKLYAPPLKWGPSVALRAHLGRATYTIKLEQVGNVPTKVVGEVAYVDEKGKEVVKEFTDSITFKTGDVVAQPKLRVNAVPTGTFVNATVN